MGYIVAILILTIGITSNLRSKTWANPASIMCYLWAFISFMVAANIYDFYEVSTKTWVIIFVGVLSFKIGTMTNVWIKTRKQELPSEIQNTQLLSPKAFWILFIVVVASLARDAITSVVLMQRGYQLSVIRLAKLGLQDIPGYSVNNNIFLSYWNDIIAGLSTILIAIGLEFFFSSVRNNKKYLLASFVLVLIDAVSEGGRWIIAYMLIECAVCYAIMKKKDRIDKSIRIGTREKIGLAISAIILIFAMEKVTSLRSLDNTSEHFIGYLCGCIPLLSIKLNFLSSNQFLTFVFSGQYGFWSLIMPYISKIFGGTLPIYSDAILIRRNTQQFEMIGAESRYNAFTSCFYYLYADLWIFGVIIGMFFFGLVASKLFKKACETNQYEISSVAPYLIVSQLILKSIQTYPLTIPSVIVVILLFLLMYKIKYSSANRNKA